MTVQTQIVQVNVTQTLAPAPSTLQKTYALISQGGTTLTPQSKSLLTQLSDLTPLLTGAVAINSLAWATSVVTVTLSAAQTWTVGDTINITIAGAAPAGYNGTFLCTVTGTTTFTYPLVANPGSATFQGTAILADVAELVAMATTWFAQGYGNSVYVLELGEGTAVEGVTDLTTWLTANPGSFYGYLVPTGWDAEATFLTLAKNYSATNAMTYFFTTATLSDYATLTGTKSIVQMIQAAAAPVTEFSIAALAWNRCNLNPSTTNQVTPTAFQYLIGVTPYAPTVAQQVSFKTGNLNFVATGAEGGISNTLVMWGVAADGNDFTYWYSVDWVQINLNLAISNEIINGSNNPANPLYYNQNGINRLQARSATVFNNAVTYGLALGNVIQTHLDQQTFNNNVNNGVYAGNIAVNAVPFATYNTQNPTDYASGIYNGLSAVYTPQRGFTQILFNVNVSSFA